MCQITISITIGYIGLFSHDAGGKDQHIFCVACFDSRLLGTICCNCFIKPHFFCLLPGTLARIVGTLIHLGGGGYVGTDWRELFD